MARAKPPSFHRIATELRSADQVLNAITHHKRRGRPALEAELVMPRTPVEEVVAGIWSQALGVEQAGVYDNFFASGGHSLLATQVLARIYETFQVELTLPQLFEAPTVASLSQQIELATQDKSGQPVRPLYPAARDSDPPLSFAQQRLWFLDQLEPGNPFYNVPGAVRLQGALNVAALHQALNAVIQRHEILRTIFPAVQGHPVQVIVPDQPLVLPVIDLEAVASVNPDMVQGLAAAEARRPFDLRRGPLVRATLLRLARDEHAGLLTLHHMVSDGWSVGIFIKELAQLYTAFATGQPAALPALPIQYADFAIWQRQSMQGAALETHLAYWRQQLANAPEMLTLPTDRARPSIQTFRGAQRTQLLPAELAAALKTLSQQEGATLFMTLMAAFTILLQRYTSQDEVIVGTTIANRTRREAENLIGSFVNSLVLRIDLSGNPSFQVLLHRVREVALAAYAHQDLSFERLVEELQPQRSLSQNPLFQVNFVLQNASVETLELPGLRVSQLEHESTTTHFDVNVDVWEREDGLQVGITYNADLFEAARIERMLDHFQVVLTAIAESPGQRLAAIPLLTETERQQVLAAWNQTSREYPAQACLHEWFEAQVARTPDAVAVVFEDGWISYAALNARANQLAHHLVNTFGVGPDVLIGLCLERSIEMVVGLLGILKAGGAYVPMEPDDPAARLAFILEDTDVPVLVSRQQAVAGLPRHSAQAVCLDMDWETISQADGNNLASRVQAQHTAYVIYTSGSTGQPKGVRIEHRQIGHYVEGIRKRYGFAPGMSFAMVKSLTVDSSQTVLFPALVTGGCLHLISKETALDPEALGAYFHNHPIDVMKIAPSHLSALQHLVPTESILPRHSLIMGGEASESAWAAELQARSQCAVFNHYGPTETTVGVLTYPLPSQPPAYQTAMVPLGRPLPNSQVYILDRHGYPVPIGVPGELYIGGDTLARGYLNRAALTAERFLPNPFSQVPGVRLYRTGDWARFLPDGHIEFLGRADDQVKIRGFRVELGEVKTALGGHADIREAVVVSQENAEGDRHLIAYIVPHQMPGPATRSLRQFLLETLPVYMVPAVFVRLDALPLTPQGKIDRRALPAPSQSRTLESGLPAAPGTSNETILVRLWARVLGLETVGIHDNFFELGGDSIQSLQVVAQAKQAGLVLTPKQLFQHQTIAELAKVVGTASAVHADQKIITGPVPLTPIQHRFFDLDLPDRQYWNQTLCLEMDSPLDISSLKTAVQHLLVHHDALRLRFVPEAATWRQINADASGTEVVSYVDVSAGSRAAQRRAIADETARLQTSLDLAQGPLMRVVLFDLGPSQPQRLLWILHHLIADAVSWRLLLEDLWTAYQQCSSGQAIQLPAKTTSFQYWAQCLTTYAQTAALRGELPYWLAESRTRAMPLPVDKPAGDNTEASARTVGRVLDTGETRALLREIHEVYHTQINDFLLTALVQTWARWTGSHALLLDLEAHGREDIADDIDLSRTVGWFTSIFPVLLELNEISSSDPGKVLKSIKEQLRSIPNRGVGYGVLRYLHRDADVVTRLTTLPQPEVRFNYLGQFEETLSSSFHLVREASGPARSPRGRRAHLLGIESYVSEGRLHLEWTYSTARHHHATVERLATDYMEALGTLIRHCQSATARGYTPSDFPEAALDQADLDTLLVQLNQPRG